MSTVTIASQPQSQGQMRPMYYNRLSHESHTSIVIPGIANYTNGNASLIVNSTAGDHALTITGGDTLADFGSGPFAAVFEDTANNRFYNCICYTIAGGVATIVPPPPTTVTGARLHNRHEATLGQHMSTAGYKALADSLYYAPGIYFGFGEPLGEVSGEYEWVSASFSAQPHINYWRHYGGIATNAHDWRDIRNLNNNGRTISELTASTEVLTQATGQGLVMNLDMSGASGIFSVSVAHRAADMTLPCQIELLSDGVSIFTETFYGALKRFYIPFGTTQDLECRITALTDTTIDSIRIGKVIVSTLPLQRKFLLPGDSLLMVGDSWINGFPGLEERLRELHDGPIHNRGLGGQTADYGLTNIDTWIEETNPTVCLIHFYINDQNQNKDAALWAFEISQICQKCIDQGVQPVVILPGGTASASQTQELSLAYGDMLGVPARLRELVINTYAPELAAATSYINNVGKNVGRTLWNLSDSEQYLATGTANTDPWKCVTNNSLPDITPA